MNLDDDSLLTAYLDDELDEPQRLAVEAALLSDPALAAQLEGLARIRDLVADLPRPGTEYDLVGPVFSRIEGRPIGPFRSRRGRKPSLATMAATLLIAASVFINILLALRQNELHKMAQAERALASRRDDKAPSRLANRADAKESTGSSTTRVTNLAGPGPALARSAPVPGPDASEIQNERERQRLLSYLDDPTVRRIFVTGDNLESTASGVDEFVKNAPRQTPLYGRITVNEGILVDADRPGEAIVFILVMDEGEVSDLRRRIERKIPFIVSEEASTPASVATLLADIGQVDVVYGSPLQQPKPLPRELVDRPAVAIRKSENKDIAAELNPSGVVVAMPVGEPTPPISVGRTHLAGPAASSTDRDPVSRDGASGGIHKLGSAGERDKTSEDTVPPDESTEKRESRATVLVWVTSRKPKDR